MKKMKMLLLAVSALLATVGVSAQTVDEVIDKYITALGGKEKLMALNTLKIVSTMTTQGQELELTTTILKDFGGRVEIAVPGVGEGYQIVTKTKGWVYLPFAGQSAPQAMPEQQLKEGQSMLDLQGPLFNYKEKGHKVELMGKELVDSVECYKVKLSHSSGSTLLYYIDTKNHYRIKMATVETVNGASKESATLYSDFRRTPEGNLFPYQQTSSKGVMRIMAVVVNPVVDDTIFSVH
jgi:hypothetical protein